MDSFKITILTLAMMALIPGGFLPIRGSPRVPETQGLYHGDDHPDAGHGDNNRSVEKQTP
jgi:hypothetical protein